GSRALSRGRCRLAMLRSRARGLSFFFSSRRRHTRLVSDWSSDVCSSDLPVDRSPSPTVHLECSTDPTGWVRQSPHPPAESRRARSEERRVGKEWGDRWGPEALKKQKREDVSRQYMRRVH